MKKLFLSSILIFVIVFNIHAFTPVSVSTTLRYNLTNTDYLFGFAANEEAAKSVTSAYTTQVFNVNSTVGEGLNISEGSATLCFYWKVLTGENLQIKLTSSGPLVKTGVEGTPSQAQQINYSISAVASSSVWNGGPLAGSIDTASPTNTQISALLKKADHTAIYTEGICNLTVTTNSGEVINSKEYGAYESTITLTIENQS